MRQYVIDELRSSDHEKLKAYLDGHFAAPEFADLYWIPLQVDLLSENQAAHSQCQPHYFALELFPDRLVCELLVRTKERVRCDCIQYATASQREWLIQAMDAIFEQLEIIT
jgi:hypothetical protein